MTQGWGEGTGPHLLDPSTRLPPQRICDTVSGPALGMDSCHGGPSACLRGMTRGWGEVRR